MLQLRRMICLLIATLATTAMAQTEYEASRGAAMQRLGTRLQAGDMDAAHDDLARYLADHPGDAVMQYNLACLAALAGDADRALAHLSTAFDAGYPDLERPLRDPDLALLAEDPRLQALLDDTRAGLVAAMQDAEVYLEEGTWSEPQPLLPDPDRPGTGASAGAVRLRFDPEGLDLEITLPPDGADEAIISVSLPRNLDDHQTTQWFEFRAGLETSGSVARVARHGRQDPAPAAGTVTVAGNPRTVHLPWSSIHPYRPPVELLLGLDVTLRRATGTTPADRWALVRDPHAASVLVTKRRFAPLVLDPGPTPARLLAGRLDTYLVVGDSLSVELGIQGLAGGDVVVRQLVDDQTDTTFTVSLAPDLDYLTLDYRLPELAGPGWVELSADVTSTDGAALTWRDRGFRLSPDWFIVQNERLAGVPETERSIVQYQLMRTLRGQQGFQPHDDPTDLATAAMAAGTMLDRVDEHGTVLPTAGGILPAAFPLGDDALQACQLVLPDRSRRAEGPLVVMLTPTQELATAAGEALAAQRAADDPRTFLVAAVQAQPGLMDQAALTVLEIAVWGEALTGITSTRFVATPGAVMIAFRASLMSTAAPVPTLLLDAAPSPFATGSWPAHITAVDETRPDADAWAASMLAWD